MAVSDATSERDREQMIDRAIKAGARADTTEPRAQTAWYDRVRDQVIIALRNGVELRIPRALLQGLQDATPSALESVEILADGFGLHWEELDADFTVPGLAAGIFGTKTWMARSGGRSRSDATVNAS